MKNLRTALVTGATGFIGSVLVDRLLADGVEVVALVRPGPRTARLSTRARIRLVEVSVWDTSSLRSSLDTIRADAIFHLASYGVQPDHQSPRLLVDGNVGVLASLLEATAHWDVRRFIHTGSCSEYGKPERVGEPIVEAQTLQPMSLYGSAKAACGSFGKLLAQRLGVPFTTLRLFGVYGPHEAEQRLMPYLIHRLQDDVAVDLTPGEQVRDLLFEDDVVRAFVSAATEDDIPDNQTYNVCSSQPVRIRTIGESIADALGKPRDLLHWGDRSYRADEPMWLVGDNQKFRNATSWAPSIDLEEGIARMIAAIRRQVPNHKTQKYV